MERFTLVSLLLAALASGCGSAPESSSAARPPNIILVMTDDQGYGDIAAHGNSMIHTPNLDKLHDESVRFTNFHVDPTCAPTRSALMTGRYSSRTGVWHTIMGRSLVHRDEVMVSNLLADAGYATAMFGKWHLGDNYPLRPEDRGFQEAVRLGGGGVTQTPDYWGNDYFDDTYWHNSVPQPYQGYCTDVFFGEAMRFIEEHRDAPFFTYIATNAPHGPFLVDEKYSQPYIDQGVPDAMAHFYGMIENIDDNMGRLEAKLSELGLRDDTLLIFMTDNGSAAGVDADGSPYPDAAWGGFNAGMRGKKGSEYEGGHRVPFFVRWPGGDLGQPRDIPNLAAHIDVLPTLAEFAAAPVPANLDIDGKSLVPLLRGQGDWPERTLTVHSQRIEWPEKWRKSSVMTTQWRLVNGEELYDVESDPSQQRDVAGDYPDVTQQLRGAYEQWWKHSSTRFEDYVLIPIGLAGENPVRITAHDWHPEPEELGVPWNQGLVKRDRPWNGYWMIDVAETGPYELTLYKYDRDAREPLGVSTARIKIGEVEASAEVAPAATSVTIPVELPAGRARMQTWLGDSGLGAMFIYANKL